MFGFRLGFGLTFQPRPPDDPGPPQPPAGFVFLTAEDGTLLTDDDGNILMETE